MHAMSKIDAQWLRERLEQKRGLKAELARRTSLSAVQISKILAGDRRIKIEEQEEIRRFFGENTLELTKEEKNLIETWRSLPPHIRQAIQTLASGAGDDQD